MNALNEKILKYNDMKKWDVCLMNPPYGSPSIGNVYLHLDFTTKILDICNHTICIMPHRCVYSTSSKYNKYKTIFTYLLSSGLSFIVDIISFSIILYFIKDRFVDAILLSSYVARAISSVVNYIVNKKYVFKNEKKRNYKAFIEYFLLVIINITISGLLVTKVYNYIHLNATFIKVIIDSIIFIINYFLQKLVIFKK